MRDAKEFYIKKKKEAWMNNLNQSIKIALAAHDIELIKKIHVLSGLVLQNFKDPFDAIDHYKHLRNIVEATNDIPLKFHVYYQLGMWYQFMKEYK